MIPITVNTIRKRLMKWGYKNLPSVQDIYRLFDKYNIRPYDVRYNKKRYNPSIMLFVQQHINELWDMQDEDEYAERMAILSNGKEGGIESNEPNTSYYHPKGMSNASIELLKNDEVWYENKERKEVKDMKKSKKVCINESQMRLLNEYVDYTDTEEFKHIFHDIICRGGERGYDIWKMRDMDGMSFEEIANRFGYTVPTVKKKYNDFMYKLKTDPFFKKMLLALLNGELNTKNVESLFNEYGGMHYGKKYVERYKDERKDKKPTMGFDGVGKFNEGIAIVERGRWPWTDKTEYNFINQQGELLSDQWFDWVYDFHEGFARVKLENRGWNFINQQGELLSNQWFEWVGDLSEGFAVVELNGKWNFINQRVKFVSKTWFDDAYSFKEGFAVVGLNGKQNFINQRGKFVSKTWFDDVHGFNEGFAWVMVNNRGYNFINQRGELLSDQWFDDAKSFNEGFARVKLNGKWNFINQRGEYLSDQWFDDANYFRGGFARVKLGGRYYELRANGRLIKR